MGLKRNVSRTSWKYVASVNASALANAQTRTQTPVITARFTAVGCPNTTNRATNTASAGRE